MKKLLTPVALILSAFIFTSCTSIDKQVFIKDKASLKRDIRIAVLPFKDAPNKEGSGTTVADTLASEMIKISNWTIVERTQMEKIMKEKKLGMSGVTDADIGQLGSVANADYLIVGSVSEFYYDRQFYIVPKTKLSFNARIIEGKTGTVIATIRYSLETNKHAWIGCCILGWYYVPMLFLGDQNINSDMIQAADDVVWEIAKDVEKKRGCCLGAGN